MPEDGIPEKFSERMIFHDKMSKNLEFDKATLKVTVGNEGRELSEEYYKVETGKGDETFRVSIALCEETTYLRNTG